MYIIIAILIVANIYDYNYYIQGLYTWYLTVLLKADLHAIFKVYSYDTHN